MFAPVVLPFQITAAIFAVALLAICVIAKRGETTAIAVVALFLLFVPSCTGVMFVVDQFRYGRFDYASESDIPDDGYIELPPTATNIVLFRNGAGHFARFTNPTDSLESWVTQMRAQRPELNSDSEEDRSTPNWPKEMRAEMLQLKSGIFANRFRDSGWSYDPSMIEFHVSRSRRGGGYSIWHLRETGDTYLSAGYW